MKRFVVFLFLLLMSASLFAQSEAAGSVAGMIKNGLFDNQDRIRQAAAALSPTEKMMLYDSYKKDQWMPFLLNLLVGAGVGSFVEGDTKGGAIALGGDLIGIGSLVLGMSTYSNAIYSDPYTSDGLGLMTFGYVALFATRIFEVVRPFTWTARYNSTLKESINYFAGMSLAPSIEDGMARMTLSYTVRLD